MGTDELATFAGGCFWCMFPPFAQLPGVKKVVSGYTGGHVENPTYQQVSSGKTGHYEAIQLTFNPHVISFEELLQVYWQQINPTDEEGQFFDRGGSYQTAIFYHSEAQKQKALAAKKNLSESGRFTKPIATKILPAAPFYPAEDYHQDYYKKNPTEYKHYRIGSGRDAFIEEHWKHSEPSADLQKKLTKIQSNSGKRD